jgi:predicted MFS family arabinose efflux permease
MGEVGFGLLTTASALGGIIGTFLYGRLERRFDLATLMKTCLLLEVLMHLALALTTVPWVALLIMFGFGAYAFVWLNVSQVVRQRAVPMEFQGRVGSVYLIFVFGGMVVGQGIGGVIAERWGLAAPFWFAFVGSALILALIWRALGDIAHADQAVMESSSTA